MVKLRNADKNINNSGQQLFVRELINLYSILKKEHTKINIKLKI